MQVRHRGGRRGVPCGFVPRRTHHVVPGPHVAAATSVFWKQQDGMGVDWCTVVDVMRNVEAGVEDAGAGFL